MRIDLSRSGGFGGIIRHASFAPGDLPPEEEATLARLLPMVDVATSSGQERPTAREVDRFQYDLTAVVDGQTVHLSASETQLPPELRQLLEELLRR